MNLEEKIGQDNNKFDIVWIERSMIDNLIKIHNSMEDVYGYCEDIIFVDMVESHYKLKNACSFFSTLCFSEFATLFSDIAFDFNLDRLGYTVSTLVGTIFGSFIFMYENRKWYREYMVGYDCDYYDDLLEFLERVINLIQNLQQDIVNYSNIKKLDTFNVKEEFKRIFTHNFSYIQDKKISLDVKHDFSYDAACEDIEFLFGSGFASGLDNYYTKILSKKR